MPRWLRRRRPCRWRAHGDASIAALHAARRSPRRSAGRLPIPINLATALRLSDARPLVVAAAQARVWVAEAELTPAKVFWVPDLNIGFDYSATTAAAPTSTRGS